MPIHQLSRRRFLGMSILTAASVTLAACAVAAQEETAVTNPDQALQRLMEGNQRFVAGKLTHINESQDRRSEVAKGQHPFATIFSCVDSRVPPELIFDRGLGDLFVIRTAGHVIDNAELGSMEFGVAELGIPLLVVLGHEKCGAVNASIEAIEQQTPPPDKIESLVEGIAPAVELARGKPGDAVANTVKTHTELTVNAIKQVPMIAEAIAAGKLKVVGGYYSLESGKVDMLFT